jgi:hypothetical protein
MDLCKDFFKRRKVTNLALTGWGCYTLSLLFLAQVNLGSLSALLNFGSLSVLACCRPILKFGSLSALARCRPLLKSGSLSTLARCRLILEFGPLSALLNLHSPATCRSRWPPANFYLLRQSPPWTIPRLCHRRHHNFIFQTQGCRIFHLEFEGGC